MKDQEACIYLRTALPVNSRATMTCRAQSCKSGSRSKEKPRRSGAGFGCSRTEVNCAATWRRVGTSGDLMRRLWAAPFLSRQPPTPAGIALIERVMAPSWHGQTKEVPRGTLGRFRLVLGVHGRGDRNQSGVGAPAWASRHSHSADCLGGLVRACSRPSGTKPKGLMACLAGRPVSMFQSRFLIQPPIPPPSLNSAPRGARDSAVFHFYACFSS